MAKNLFLAAAFIVLAAALAVGCKRQSAGSSGNPSGYFKTPFQDESQFIVEAIVSDLAEQMFYAASHKLPDPNYFQVTATEKAGSPRDTPVYELQIRLDSKKGTINSEVDVNGPIWAPEVYSNVVVDLGNAVGLPSGSAETTQDTIFLSKLTDNSPETIEQKNEDLSSMLEDDFKNPALHEQAAALLGAFLLRDHSGHFFEIRSPLCRMTAHLAMAQFLNGGRAYGINGQMAEAMLLTLMNDESPALAQLNAIGTNDPAIAPIVHTLWTRNTGDYRLLGSMDDLTPMESSEWFCSMSDYLKPDMAWPKLSDVQQRTIDFVRIANQNDYSVEMGHQLSTVAVPLEMKEIQSVSALSGHKLASREELLKALNEMPERCFTTASDGTVHVRIIGWGQWADFLQRHLCHSIQQTFYFMQYEWGVPDDAKAFASKCDEEFGGLRLYPFVQRFDCIDADAYHKSEDDGFKVTVATPQFVPADCWNWLCWKVDFAPLYVPSPNPHINEWHNHNPPPGTVYDLNPRLYHPSLTDRGDAVDYFEKMHEWAPYDCRVINFILKHKYNNQPTYFQAGALYGDMPAYSLTAALALAGTVTNDPPRYEKLMIQAAQLDPICFYYLGSYELDRNEDDQAAAYYQKACDADPNSVRVANMAPWRVRYYLKKGDTATARQIAEFAGEVYSYRGLEAEAIFFEQTSNYDEAFKWNYNIEDRYNDSIPLIQFCLWRKETTGDTQYDPELEKRLDKLFPKGNEQVSLSDFQGAPSDGVLIKEENDRIRAAGLAANDVVVALQGRRVHNFLQYRYVRDKIAEPELDLIVWHRNTGAYSVVKASPPKHLFGVSFVDFTPQ
jgi:tetratricopeptide (TPR) repeat protein